VILSSLLDWIQINDSQDHNYETEEVATFLKFLRFVCDSTQTPQDFINLCRKNIPQMVISLFQALPYNQDSNVTKCYISILYFFDSLSKLDEALVYFEKNLHLSTVLLSTFTSFLQPKNFGGGEISISWKMKRAIYHLCFEMLESGKRIFENGKLGMEEFSILQHDIVHLALLFCLEQDAYSLSVILRLIMGYVDLPTTKISDEIVGDMVDDMIAILAKKIEIDEESANLLLKFLQTLDQDPNTPSDLSRAMTSLLFQNIGVRLVELNLGNDDDLDLSILFSSQKNNKLLILLLERLRDENMEL